MGFRTVVVLNNDQASEWNNDAELGQKISRAASLKDWPARDAIYQFPYGEVVEQVHADTQTVAFLDGCGGRVVAHSFWHHGQTEEQKNLEMLKALADKLGYRVVKKTEEKD